MRQFQYDPACCPDDDFLDDEYYEQHARLESEAAKAAAWSFQNDEPVTEEDLPW